MAFSKNPSVILQIFLLIARSDILVLCSSNIFVETVDGLVILERLRFVRYIILFNLVNL